MTARIVVMLYFILCEATWSKILEQNRFRVLEWSEWDKRHGRLSREVAVERGGSSRDTMEPRGASDMEIRSPKFFPRIYRKDKPSHRLSTTYLLNIFFGPA